MIRFWLRRPVLVTLTLLLIVLFGLVAYKQLTIELWPPVNFNQIVITTLLPGASAEEVERLITAKIEDEVADVEDIDTLESVSFEGTSIITVFFPEWVKDMEEKLRDVQLEVNKVRDLPDDATDPSIEEIDTSIIPCAQLTVSGGSDELERKLLAEDLADDFEDIPGVASAEVFGAREREFRIEYDPDRLQAYRLTPQAIAQLVGARYQNMPVGTLKVGQREIIVRAMGEPEVFADLADMVLLSMPGGQVRLRDVAMIVDTFDDPATISRVNGRPCISINVSKEAKAGTLDVVARVQAEAEAFAARNPGIVIDTVWDDTTDLKIRLRDLVRNGLFGFGVVLLVLWAALGVRQAVFVALGLPVSMLITFGIMMALDISINFMTLFGFIIVLGIVVDDAIVCVENITRYMEEGMSPKRAALRGATEVVQPVIVAVVTTMVSFSVLFMMKGDLAPWMAYLAYVVLFMLTASLMDAFFFIPTHVAEWVKVTTSVEADRRARGIRWLQDSYERVVRKLLRRPLLSLLIPLGAFVAAMGAATRLPFEMFPPEEPDWIFVNFELEEDVRLEETLETALTVERRVLARGYDDVHAVLTCAEYGMSWDDPRRKYFGQVALKMRARDEITGSGFELADELRELIADLPARHKEVRIPEGGPPMGRPIEVRVAGDDWSRLEAAGAEIKTYLAGLPHVINLDDNRKPGNRELHVRIDESKLRDGNIRFQDFALALRGALSGIKASERRMGDDEVDIVVRGIERTRHNEDSIGDLAIPTTTGGAVKLRSVATIEEARGIAVIHRRDREHTITITADIDDIKGAPTPVTQAQLLKERFADLPLRYGDATLYIGGEAESTQESFGSLQIALLFAVIVIFMLLVIQFNSLGQPFAVITAVPIGLVGVVVGLLLTGNVLGITAMIGIVALAGVVINDSLVLVDFANRYRSEHPEESLRETLVMAGRVRLRPVLLTTATTVGGLLPMAVGLGGKSVMWAPLATSIIAGLLATTPFILLFMPPLLVVIHALESRCVRILAPYLPQRDPRDEGL